jgi:hypothetical protein
MGTAACEISMSLGTTAFFVSFVCGTAFNPADGSSSVCTPISNSDILLAPAFRAVSSSRVAFPTPWQCGIPDEKSRLTSVAGLRAKGKSPQREFFLGKVYITVYWGWLSKCFCRPYKVGYTLLAQDGISTASAHASKYEHSLYDANTFSVTWELVPGRGAFEKTQQDLIEEAQKAAASGRVHALTITDNPGGQPALSAEMLGAEIGRLGIEPLVHLTCKDKNRNQLESLLYGLERAGVHNLLVMTGDLPKSGYGGAPKPVFDLDPVTLLGLISELNAGKEVPKPGGKTTTLRAAGFFRGSCGQPLQGARSRADGAILQAEKEADSGSPIRGLAAGLRRAQVSRVASGGQATGL